MKVSWLRESKCFGQEIGFSGWVAAFLSEDSWFSIDKSF